MCSKEYYTTIFLHLRDIAFTHCHTTTTGNDHILLLLHLDQKIGFHITEVFLPIGFKNIGNTHAFAFCNQLVHLNHFHGKHGTKIIRDRTFSSSHKPDQDNIVIKKLSSLDLLTVALDTLKYIINLVSVLIIVKAEHQSLLLLFFLFRLQDRHAILFFVCHDLFNDRISFF